MNLRFAICDLRFAIANSQPGRVRLLPGSCRTLISMRCGKALVRVRQEPHPPGIKSQIANSSGLAQILPDGSLSTMQRTQVDRRPRERLARLGELVLGGGR